MRGFTLVELIIVVLTEGKAMAGSVLTAFQGCTQAKGPGRSCTLTEIARRIGVSNAGLTGDGRWTVVTTSRLAVSTSNPPNFTGTIQVFGRTPNNVAAALSLFPTTRGVILRCTTTSSTPPASSTAGSPC